MRYPYLVLPLLLSFIWSYSQETEITGFDTEFADLFGFDVAIDGDYMVVGAPLNDGFWTQGGAAYVFQLSGGTWNYAKKLVPNDNDFGDQFGYSVDIDGNTIIIGAIHDDEVGMNAGAVYIFSGSGNSWNQMAKLTAADGSSNENFGKKVVISGNYAAVGMSNDDTHGASAGAVYVFEKNWTDWTQKDKLFASDADDGDVFGACVDIYGEYLVAGAPSNMGDVWLQSGAAYIFQRINQAWTQVARITHQDQDAFDHFGESVAIYDEYVIVGAPFKDDKAGATYIFKHSNNGSWLETSKLNASDGSPHDKFGISVDIQPGQVMVGAFLEDEAGPDAGAFYVFEGSESTWMETIKHTADDAGVGDHFARQVSLSGDYAVAGAHFHDDVATDAGAAYIYGPAFTVVPDQVRGPAMVCPNVSNVPYEVPMQIDAISYNWSFAGSGATIHQNGDSVVYLDFSPAASAGILSVECETLSGPTGLVMALPIEMGDEFTCAYASCLQKTNLFVDSAVLDMMHGMHIFNASNRIESNAVFPPDDFMLFQAGNEIILHPNFELPLGSVFIMEIKACEDP